MHIDKCFNLTEPQFPHLKNNVSGSHHGGDQMSFDTLKAIVTCNISLT